MICRRHVRNNQPFGRFLPHLQSSPSLMPIEQRRHMVGKVHVPKDIRRRPDSEALRDVIVELRDIRKQIQDPNRISRTYEQITKRKLEDRDVERVLQSYTRTMGSQLREIAMRVETLRDRFLKSLQRTRAQEKGLELIDQATLDFRETWNVLSSMGISKQMDPQGPFYRLTPADHDFITGVFGEAREVTSAFLNLIKTAEKQSNTKYATLTSWRKLIEVMSRSMQPRPWSPLGDKMDDVIKSIPEIESKEEVHVLTWDSLRQRYYRLLAVDLDAINLDKRWQLERREWNRFYKPSKQPTNQKRYEDIVQRLQRLFPDMDISENSPIAKLFEKPASTMNSASLELDLRERVQKWEMARSVEQAGAAIDEHYKKIALKKAKSEEVNSEVIHRIEFGDPLYLTKYLQSNNERMPFKPNRGIGGHPVNTPRGAGMGGKLLHKHDEYRILDALNRETKDMYKHRSRTFNLSRRNHEQQNNRA